MHRSLRPRVSVGDRARSLLPLLMVLALVGCGGPDGTPDDPTSGDPCGFVGGTFPTSLSAAACQADPESCAKELNACLAHTDYLEGDTWWVLQVPGFVERVSKVKQNKPTLRQMGGSNTITPMHGRHTTILLNETAANAFNQVIVQDPQGHVDKASLPYGSVIVKINYTSAEPLDPSVAAIEGEPWLTVMAKIEGYCNPTIGGSCIGGEWFYYLYRFGDFLEFTDIPVWGKPQAFCTDCHNPVAEHDFVWNLHLYMRGRVAPYFQDPAPASLPPTPTSLPPQDVCAADHLGISSTLPSDLPVDPQSYQGPVSDVDAMVNCYSWRSFLAVNWPAQAGQRGVPEGGSSLSDVSSPRVWETYKETAEVFQPEDPTWTLDDQAWDDSQPLPAVCEQAVEGLEGSPKLIQMITKTRSHQILDETHQAMGNQFNVLVDQDGKLIRYEVRFNRDEFEYLKSNDFANTGNYSFDGPKNGPVFFPTQVEGFTGDGSIEIKAAWRELCVPDPSGQCSAEEEQLSERYYHQTSLIYTPESKSGPATCRVARAGLVGFHLIRKTYLAPQWVWATFEHVDNVPPFEGGTAEAATSEATDSGGPYLLNGGCDGKTPPDEFCSLMRPGAFPAKKLAELGVEPPAGTDANCCPNAQLILNAHPGKPADDGRLQADDGGPLVKNQITRLVEVGPREMNARFQGQLAAPWSNYFLLNAQYPSGARQTAEQQPAHAARTIPCNVRNLLWLEQGSFESAFVQAGIPKPECFDRAPLDAAGNPVQLRNTTMETFQATWNDPATASAQQVSSQSCLNCHGFSGVDGSFVFTDAEEIVVPLGAGAAEGP